MDVERREIKMIFKGRLINKDRPTLIIKKDKRLKTQGVYRLRFIGNERDEELTAYLQNFNNEFYCFKFVQKVKGAFKLKYQNDYEVDIEEIELK